jgi:hypothetical protein
MATKLRSLFTDNEVKECLPQEGETCVDMALALTSMGRGEVSPQLCRYWKAQFDKTKHNGDNYLTLIIANRELKEKRQPRLPRPSDLLATVDQGSDPTRILNFGDNHAPFSHKDAISFLSAVNDKFKPTMVIHNGDEVDNHALSFHDSDPNLDSAGMELEKAREWIQELEAVFPLMRLLESNHGSLAYRKAKAHGIPVAYIKDYREVLFNNGGGEGWSWHDTVRIENEWGRDMQFQHQGTGDLMTHAARENACLYVGHEHGKYGIGYTSSAVDTFHSVYCGCLIDIPALAFAYGKHFKNKPVLGCAVIIEGTPQLIPMKVDNHNRWIGSL